MYATTLARAFIDAAAVPDLGVRFWEKPGTSALHTYEELVSDARRIATSLQRRGLKKGDIVALVLPTCLDFYRAYFAIVFCGAVPAALYPPVRLGRITEWKERTATMLSSVNAAAIITEFRLLGVLAEPVIQAQPKLGALNTQKLMSESFEAELVHVEPGALAAIQFSSGTTGTPRPVALSHRNMISCVLGILSEIPDHGVQSGVSWLPLYHDMGLIGCMLLAIIGKGPLTLLQPEKFIANPRCWLEALTETEATISVAPNFAFGLTANKVRDTAGLDLSNWNIALCGAEPVHLHTLERFATQFSPCGFREEALTPVYGLAEASLALTFSPLDQKPRWDRFNTEVLNETGIAKQNEAGHAFPSLGKPLSGVQIEIRDENGRICGPNQVGSVWAKGPGIMLGYYNVSDQSFKGVKPDGWFETGDHGFIHDGNLYLCGRKKDLIIINGRNHDPAVIEQSLDDIDQLRPGSAAAFAVETTESDTEQCIIVAELSSEPNDEDELKILMTQAVQRHTGLVPYHIELVPKGTIPKTSSGKIQRQRTREQWLSGTLAAVDNSKTWPLLKETIRGLVRISLRKPT